MSGKPKGPTGWGGSRPGAGRKPAFATNDAQVMAMLRLAKKRAKTEGKTIDDVLLDIIYNKQAYEVEKRGGRVEILMEVTPKDRLAAIKVFKEYTIGKRTESETHNHNYNHPEPIIELPEKRPDPGLKLVAKLKKKEEKAEAV